MAGVQVILTVNGSRFLANMTATLLAPGSQTPTSVPVENLVLTNPQHFTLTFTFSMSGSWILKVRNPDGKTDQLTVVVMAQPPPVPGPPTNPNPPDGATGVATAAGVSWAAATNATSYTVAFGMSTPPPVVSASQTGTTYQPATLANNTLYYWQITATNSSGSTVGPVWSFTTVAQQTGGDYVCANGAFTLNADILLTGTQTVNLAGTPTAPCVVTGNGHRFVVDGGGGFVGSIRMAYADVTGLGTAVFQGLAGPVINGTYTTYAYLNGATVDIQHTTFHSSGGINLYAANGAAITFSRNVAAADNLVPAGGPADQAAPWFVEQGDSPATKYFQGNRIFRAFVTLGSPNWIVGAAQGCTTTCDADGNLLIGRRVGLSIGNASSYAAYNYIHLTLDVTPTEDFWSQVGNIGPLGSTAIAEHNILRTGHWVAAGIDGELRNNVILEANGHDWLRTSNGGRIHHNIFTGVYQGVDRYSAGSVLGLTSASGLLQAGNSWQFYNNTIDGRASDGPSYLINVVDGATLTSWRNNAAYKLRLSALSTAVGPDESEGYLQPPPARALYLDYNDTYFDPASATQRVYDLAGQSGYGSHDLGTFNGQGLDPAFRGPLPIGTNRDGVPVTTEGGFPFNDADILNGTYPVSQLLAYYRWIYAPASGSPLIGHQDPQDGPGDIGAVQVSTLPPSAPAIVTTNKRPMVYAGPSFSLPDPSQPATLSGYAADDGLPSNALTVQWSLVSGPAGVLFANASRSLTTATFTASGTYVLRLTASDGVLSSTSDATITISGSAGPVTPMPVLGHPLIWLDAATLTTVKAKYAANDVDVLAIKADADRFLTSTIPPFDRDACGTNQICYTYQGAGWYGALSALGFAYQVTGNAAYCTKVSAILTSINATVAAGNLLPISADSGYPSRALPSGLALALDWCAPQLTAATRAATITTGNAWYDWTMANALSHTCAGPNSAIDNYFFGHVYGYGLFGFATAGDNARAAEITAHIHDLFQCAIPPAFNGGILSGGAPIEGYVYGTNTFARILMYLTAVKTATGVDLVSGSGYGQKILTQLTYAMKPDRFRFPDEADYPGSYTGLFQDPTLAYILPTMLKGSPTDSAKAMSFAQRMIDPRTITGYGPEHLPLAIWRDLTLPATDYTAGRSLAYDSPGDEHLLARTGWDETAVWVSFNGGSSIVSGHQSRIAGHVAMQRGTDPLLVNSGQWKGTSGWGGDPQVFDGRAWRGNTLWYQNPWGGDYTGGQGWWGVTRVVASQITPTYAYKKADVSSQYINNINTGLKAFTRSVVVLQPSGTTLVFDHVVAGLATDLKKLIWHVSPNTTGRKVTGTVFDSGVIGASRLFIQVPCCLTTPSLAILPDPLSDSDPTTMTYRLEVTDAAQATTMDVLTVLQPVAATVTVAPPVSVVSSTQRVVSIAGRTVTFSLTGDLVSVQ